MDALLDDLFVATDPAEQLELAKEVQELYIAQTFEVSLYDRSAVLGIGARLQGLAQNVSTQSDQWNIEDWFIQE
jgi:ABC-type transport system substrate-binding protein